MLIRHIILTLILTSTTVIAQDAVPIEADYYKLLSFEIPKAINLESGAIEVLSDGNLAVSTLRGDIYVVNNAWSDNPAAEFKQFAMGLHEVLGL